MDTRPAQTKPTPWAIYEEKDWPAIAGRVFMPQLFLDVVWARCGIPVGDCLIDPESAPLRDWLAGRIAAMLLNGSMAIAGQPIAGGELIAVTPAELTTERAGAAISTGLVRLRRGGDEITCWVFAGEKEASVLIQLLAWEISGDGADALLERLADLTLANLSGLVGNGAVSTADGARRVLALLLPNLRPILGKHDRQKVVDAAADWLRDGFAADPLRKRLKTRYRDELVPAFSPYLTVRMFNDAWAVVADAGRRRGGRRGEEGVPELPAMPSRAPSRVDGNLAR